MEIKRVMTEKNKSAFEASRIITGKYQDKTTEQEKETEKAWNQGMKEE